MKRGMRVSPVGSESKLCCIVWDRYLRNANYSPKPHLPTSVSHVSQISDSRYSKFHQLRAQGKHLCASCLSLVSSRIR